MITKRNKILIDKLHYQLRRARYFYYHKDAPEITDYEYDILEKQYEMLCNDNRISLEKIIDNFVGYSDAIPMSIFYTFNN